MEINDIICRPSNAVGGFVFIIVSLISSFDHLLYTLFFSLAAVIWPTYWRYGVNSNQSMNESINQSINLFSQTISEK